MTTRHLLAPGCTYLPHFLTPADQRELQAVARGDAGAWAETSNAGRGTRTRTFAHPEADEPDAAPIPPTLAAACRRAAAAAGVEIDPGVCVAYRYGDDGFRRPRTSMSWTREPDDRTTPVVMISIGAEATFRLGGTNRWDSCSELTLRSGDAVVMNQAASRLHHAIGETRPGTEPAWCAGAGDAGTRLAGRLELIFVETAAAETRLTACTGQPADAA